MKNLKAGNLAKVTFLSLFLGVFMLGAVGCERGFEREEVEEEEVEEELEEED